MLILLLVGYLKGNDPDLAAYLGCANWVIPKLKFVEATTKRQLKKAREEVDSGVK